MIRSMTGYGRSQMQLGGKDITVEIKSVNHRYFEFSARTGRGYAFLEEKLKSYVQSRVSRGKVDVYVSIVSVDDNSVEVELNRPLAAGYLKAFEGLENEFGVRNDVTVSTLARISDLFTVRRVVEDEDQIWANVRTVAEAAVDAFIATRETEGERMRADIDSRLETILAAVGKVEREAPETVRQYNERLRQKMQELLGDTQIDQQRLLTECALFADRIAVDEETVRLRSHIEHFRSIFASGEPVGRKLDFVVQEMNRETNTIGSKSQNTEIAYTVVEIKSEIEKIREQIQNIE